VAHPVLLLLLLLLLLLQLTDALLYHVSPAIFTTPFTNTTAIPTLFTPNTLDLVAPTTVVATGSTAGVVTPNIWFPGVSVTNMLHTR
jgi:hypothetical protein